MEHFFSDGFRRARSHKLIFENAPDCWQNGFPVGNGDFGGVVYQPDESVFEIAFTRLNLWKQKLAPTKRTTLAELRELSHNAPEKVAAQLQTDVRAVETPSFKPGGRLRLWLDEFDSFRWNPLFDKHQELDIAGGEVTGGYELSGKAMERTTLAATDCDVIATHLRDTYLHPLQVGTYLPQTQRLELYRLYDPQAKLLASGVTDAGMLYLEFGFGDSLRAVCAAMVSGVPWHTPVVQDASVSIELSLDYVKEPYPHEYTVFQTLTVAPDGQGDLIAKAEQLLQQAARRGFADLQAKTRAWYRDFWSRSGITLDNPALEALWYNNLYQYATECRGETAPALFGLWNAERSAPWKGDYHGDINLAMVTWPLFALNHPELQECFFKTFARWLPAIREETRRLWEGDGEALRFPLACGPDGAEMTPGIYRSMQCASGFYADFYRKFAEYRPGDKERIRREIFPVLEGCAKFYLQLTERDARGKLRIGPSWAPEQGKTPAWNVANDLGLIKPLWEAVVKWDERLAVGSETARRVRSYLAEFPDYPQADGEFRDSDVELSRTELCHPGYLACVVPGGDVDADSPLAEVARRTMRSHLEHTCRKGLAGKIGSACDLTWGWLFNAALRLRDTEFAETVLCDVGLRDFVKSNGMFAFIGGRIFDSLSAKRTGYDVPNAQPHALLAQSGSVAGREKSMCMPQQGGAFLSGVMEAMLQSHHGEIKLFPAVLPVFGKQVAFYGLAAAGGLTVSAAWCNGRTEQFELRSSEAEYHGKLRFFDGTQDAELRTEDGKCLAQVAPGVYALHLAPGEILRWRRSAEAQPAEASALPEAAVKPYFDDLPIEYGKRGHFFEQ